LTAGLAEDGLEELGGDVALEQPVPVLREHGHVPDRIIDAEADEPAEQRVVIQLLHEVALGADRIEGLEHERARNSVSGGNGRAYSFANSPERSPSAASTNGRMRRSGWSRGTRPSTAAHPSEDHPRASPESACGGQPLTTLPDAPPMATIPQPAIVLSR
jgi:hypothetical protein